MRDAGPKMKNKPTIILLVVPGVLLAAYIGVYVVLSLGGRYEPGAIGLGGVRLAMKRKAV